MIPDNASANDACLWDLERIADDPSGRRWRARELRVRCPEYTLHLVAKPFAGTVCPTPSTSRSKGKQAMIEDVDDDEDDFGKWKDADDGGDADDSAELGAGGVPGKVLGLI